MSDLTPDQIRRRSELAWLLTVAETCPSYAASAAREREKIGRNHGCPSMFAGLGDRFDLEWAKRPIQEKKK